MAKKKSSTYGAGTGKVRTKRGVGKPTTATRRRTSGTDVKLAPLPESCHYTKTGATRAAETLRKKQIKARVVTSGQFYCVYSVSKCTKGGKQVGVKRG